MINKLSAEIHRKIWGGKKLEKIKNLESLIGEEPIGETWEISNKNNKKNLLYTVKLIDTDAALSVQVHPDDEYARLHENSTGKSECWLILEAKKNAVIYLGLKPEVTRDFFMTGIKNGEAMNEYLNSYTVLPGDFFYIPSGTVHAIGEGITLAEVQQNSGITYRVWDWNRLDAKGEGRELHIKKSLEVMKFSAQDNSPGSFLIQKNLFQREGKIELLNHSSFRLFLINVGKNQSFKEKRHGEKQLFSLVSLHGQATVNGESFEAYSAAILEDEKKLEINSHVGSSFLLIE